MEQTRHAQAQAHSHTHINHKMKTYSCFDSVMFQKSVDVIIILKSHLVFEKTLEGQRHTD